MIPGWLMFSLLFDICSGICFLRSQYVGVRCGLINAAQISPAGGNPHSETWPRRVGESIYERCVRRLSNAANSSVANHIYRRCCSRLSRWRRPNKSRNIASEGGRCAWRRSFASAYRALHKDLLVWLWGCRGVLLSLRRWGGICVALRCFDQHGADWKETTKTKTHTILLFSLGDPRSRSMPSEGPRRPEAEARQFTNGATKGIVSSPTRREGLCLPRGL